MELIKFSVFLHPKSNFCISTVTFCLPSQIWILFEIHAETLGASALMSADAPCRSSTLPHSLCPELFYTLHNRKGKIEQDGVLYYYYLYFTPVPRLCLHLHHAWYPHGHRRRPSIELWNWSKGSRRDWPPSSSDLRRQMRHCRRCLCRLNSSRQQGWW